MMIIDYKKPFKLTWRIIQSLRLRNRNVNISPFALWNGKTTFGGNNTIMEGTCVGGSIIGRYTYIYRNSYLPDSMIGSFCSIAQDVRIIQYVHPTRGFVSTCPAFFSTRRQCVSTFVKENKFKEQNLRDNFSAIIGNDVWIGESVRIIEGIKIGDGAIVAAGAFVTKDVPPYAIVGGVPAKIIRFRFSEGQITSLLKLKWWDKPEIWLEENAELFSNIDNLLTNLKND